MSTRVTGEVFAVVLSTLAMNFGSIAKAGDLELQPYGPGPYTAPTPYTPPPAQYVAPIDRGGICRIVFERRIDPYGRETVHRIRVCDEGPVYPGYPAPTWSAVPPEYGYGRPPYHEPFRSYYDDYPRPPAPIGRIYYN
jgi:hypothetical protein